jgi:hypothetical protein
MGRSGTTLLEKLLGLHCEIDILSQPFPLVFIEAKKRFLRQKGQDDYFILNADLIGRDYQQAEFDEFLSKLEFSGRDLSGLFERMKNYSGQTTRPDRVPNESGPQPYTGFFNILENAFDYFSTDSDRYIGLKEIMCEEFIPYMLGQGYRCIVIVRDPRDMLASANYPSAEKFLGEKKPTLFLLRTWRKSIEYCRMFEENESFFHLRYEDLVREPQNQLAGLANFLGISVLKPESVGREIKDRSGNAWMANTSRSASYSGVSGSSLESYKKVLSSSEMEYTESICLHEMKWLGYPLKVDLDHGKCIAEFKDQGVRSIHGLPADFSTRQNHVAQELERLEQYQNFYPSN